MAAAVTTWSAGDHDRADAGLEAGLDRRADLFTGRVNHADEAQQGEALFQALRGEGFGEGVDILVTDRQYPQRLFAHLVADAVGFRDVPGGAAADHHVVSAFDDDKVFPAVPA